ncbi:MAG: oligosaccharide flippase family protein [Candidatus Hydrogenedentes bacterium]|nr:oligosaccharide flippase family protein [Candidatus Hydrogenedentota bacterium]
MSQQKTIAHNTLFNAAGRGFEALVALVLTWYVLREIGQEGWGLWSLAGAFTGYAALLDIGLSEGFVKFVARHDARSDPQAVGRVIATGSAFYAFLSVLILLPLWPLIGWCADLISTWSGAAPDDAVIPELVFLLRGSLVLFLLNNIMAPLVALPLGMQRMGIANLLGFGATMVKTVATVSFLEGGFGVRGLLYANAVVLAALAAAYLVLLFRLLPGIRPRWNLVSLDTFRELYGFGWRTQVARLANLVNFQTDRIVIAFLYKLSDVALIGLYSLGEMLANKMRQGPALLVTALLPAASGLDARDDHAKLQRLYIVATKYMALAACPIALFFFIHADMLLHAWLGGLPDLHTAAWVARLLVVGYFANLIPGPGMSIALGKGHSELAMHAGIISTVANIVLTISGWYLIGFYAIPLGTTLGMFISNLWFFRRVGPLFAVSTRRLAREALFWPAVACLPGACLTAPIQWRLLHHDGHAINLAAVLASLLIFTAAYVLTLRRLPCLDAFDVRFLADTLRLRRMPGFAWFTRGVRHA